MVTSRLHCRVYELPIGKVVIGVSGGGTTMEQTERRVFYDVTTLHRPKYLLHYLMEGQGWYETEADGRSSLQPGAVFQRTPGLIHRSWFAPGRPYRDWYLLFSATLLPSLHELGLLPLPRPVQHIGVDPDISAAFARLQRRIRQADHSTAVLLDLHHLLAVLQDACRRDQSAPGWLASAQERLQDPACNDSLATIADRFGLSEDRFRRDFRTATGMPPGRYRIRARIDTACRLLAEATVTDVAAQLGYPDVPSFSKQFRAQVGLPPGQYRKLVRG